jgi:hypothetical protein
MMHRCPEVQNVSLGSTVGMEALEYVLAQMNGEGEAEKGTEGQGRFPAKLYPVPFVRREKVSIFSGRNSRPATFAPAGSNLSGGGGNETAEASDG